MTRWSKKFRMKKRPIPVATGDEPLHPNILDEGLRDLAAALASGDGPAERSSRRPEAGLQHHSVASSATSGLALATAVRSSIMQFLL